MHLQVAEALRERIAERERRPVEVMRKCRRGQAEVTLVDAGRALLIGQIDAEMSLLAG